MVKGVIFDFNGVIIDDYPIQKIAWNHLSHLLRKRGVTDQEMLENIRGVPTKNVILRMANSSITQERLNELAKEKEEMVRKLYAKSSSFCLNKGLAKFLDKLKSNNMPRNIATSSTLNDMQFSFNRLGLNQWFDISLVIYNDGSFKGKPAPDPYMKATAKLNLSPSDCAIFEDAASGIKSAFTAGSTRIIAVGSKERLQKLTKLDGVILGIHDFTEISFEKLINF